MVVFQFTNDIRAGKKVCYTLSRCPHRLAAKDATLSRWISRVRIPLGAPQHLSRSRRVFRLGLFSFRRMCAKPVRQMCAKPAENRPSDSSRGNGKDPARSVRGPAAGLSVSPFGPSATVLLAPRLPLGRSSLGHPLATPRRAPLPARTATPRPIAADRRARVQITPSERRTAPHGTARPSALDIPLCARPFATRLLGLLPVRSATPRAFVPRPPLGYPSACAFARPHGYPSPHRRGPPRPRADHPKRKADRSPRNGPPLGARYSLMR